MSRRKEESGNSRNTLPGKLQISCRQKHTTILKGICTHDAKNTFKFGASFFKRETGHCSGAFLLGCLQESVWDSNQQNHLKKNLWPGRN
jgi:hypothetical protein